MGQRTRGSRCDVTALSDLLALGEGFTIEFKRSLPSDLGREICAFANATGGVILLGVDDDGTVCGVEAHNRLKSRVQSIARSADPPISVEVESMGDVLAVRVLAQRGKPYSFGGKFFIRDGASSQQMSRDEIREFFFAEGVIHLDESPCRRFSLDSDLGEETWAVFRRRAKIPDHMEPETALGNLHLLAGDGWITNAGAWLLAENIRKFHASAHLSCALFQGTTKTRILDRRDYPGDLYSMIEGAMTWVRSKINVHYVITASVKREERPELPMDAVREAVVNAVAHRDYRSTANVQVCLFHDRLEVVSPGGLPAGMTEAELGVKSVPRNPLLFGMLHRMDAVEHIGSGIRRIRDLCREWGVPAPVIDVSEHWVTVTFRRPALGGEGSTATSEGPGRDQVGTKSGPSRDQVAILRKALSEHPMTELMAVMGRTNRTKFRDQVLRPLLDAGWLEMTIPDKPTSRKQRYRTTAAGREVLVAVEGGEEWGRYPTQGPSDQNELPMVRSPRREWPDE